MIVTLILNAGIGATLNEGEIMRSARKITWLSLCGLVLFYWVYSSYFSPDIQDAYNAEAQGILLLLLMILSFPSGLIWYLMFSLILFGLDAFSITRPVVIEVIMVWAGFVVVGYLQWFKYGPFIADKFAQWRKN